MQRPTSVFKLTLINIRNDLAEKVYNMHKKVGNFSKLKVCFFLSQMEMLKILKFYFKSFNINSYITKYDFGILDTQMNLIALSRILNIIF